jgi:cobalt-precorrin 5A hydrolase/precorrin-3B C17-methyltransferase
MIKILNMDTGNKNQRTEVRSQKSGVKTAIFYITGNGLNLAKRLQELYPEARIEKFNSKEVRDLWHKHKNLIFIMASGIVVRTISPLIKDKRTDPAVVVLDEKGKFAISLLSGHLGGANRLAKEIADFLNSKKGLVGETMSPPRTEAVITTASDVNNMPSIDLWARENDLIIEDPDALPTIASRFLNKRVLKIYSDINIPMPKEFQRTDMPKSADLIVTNKNYLFTHSPIHPFTGIYLRPKNLVVGIGCNKGTPDDEIENAIKSVLKKNNLSFLSIYSIATIDKKDKEPGLIAFAKKYNLRIKTFTASELNSAISYQPSAISYSESAFKATGAYAVAEPAAMLASGDDKLLVQKQKVGNVTIAISECGMRNAECEIYTPLHPSQEGNSKIQNPKSKIPPKLYIVGTGPGSIEHITPYAQDAIRRSDVIVGYGTYLDLIKEIIKDKEVISTGMTAEVDRCRKAVELALSGKTVSVISGGDPGIYAMAGLVLEILKDETEKWGNGETEIKKQHKTDTSPIHPFTHPNRFGGQAHSPIQVEVIPGISALNSSAARLGAPLMHDFAAISLSDRLTPWELIEKRLEAAAKADFVIILYNPKSMGRQEHIGIAREIILRHRVPETPVGIVKSAMRENEGVIITTLQDMLNHDIDMQTTVTIGNSQTFIWNNRMITPRGYSFGE